MPQPISRTFAVFDFKSEAGQEFQEDLRTFLALDENAKRLVLDALPGLLIARSEPARQAEEEALIQAAKVPVDAILRAVSCLTFFVTKFVDRGRDDDSDSLIADLQAVGLVQAEEAKSLLGVLSELKEDIVPRYRLPYLRRKAAVGIMPFLEAVSATVELRGVPTERFDLTKGVENYVPDFEDELVPLASISIRTDIGRPLQFQVDKEILHTLVQALTSVEKDLAALELRFATRATPRS